MRCPLKKRKKSARRKQSLRTKGRINMDESKSEQIFKIYSEAKNRILLYIEASVPPDQFKALRKLVLNELGRSGAEGKVRKILSERTQAGM